MVGSINKGVLVLMTGLNIERVCAAAGPVGYVDLLKITVIMLKPD